MTEQNQPDTASMAMNVGVSFTLTVQLADGTTKEIPCVGRVTSVTKEQDNGDLRS